MLAADADPRRLLDVQWCTEHLATLGAVPMSRERYLHVLATALTAGPPPALVGPASC